MVRIQTVVSHLCSCCFSDTPEGDTPPLSIGAAAVKVSSAALLKGKDESDNARDGGSDGESRDDPEAGADDGPTDDMLRKALREVVAGTADLGSITAKNVRFCTLW